MMKKLCILPLLLAFVACTHIDYARRLVDADSLLSVRPDSAWQVLQEVSLADLRDEGEQAWYALLQTEAAVRGGHSLSGDSLIRVAVDYYDRKGDVEMQARAHYWAGNAYRRLEEEERLQAIGYTAVTARGDVRYSKMENENLKGKNI